MAASGVSFPGPAQTIRLALFLNGQLLFVDRGSMATFLFTYFWHIFFFFGTFLLYFFGTFLLYFFWHIYILFFLAHFYFFMATLFGRLKFKGQFIL